MKCDRCGAKSIWERYFFDEAWGFGSRGRMCLGCWWNKQLNELGDVQRYMIGLIAVGLIMGFGESDHDDWGLMILALPALVVAHELAHAVAGWLVGLRIHQVRIGYGRIILRFRIGSVRLDVGSLFLVPGGHCLVTAPGEPARWRDAVCTGAPLLMHAALIPVSIACGWPPFVIGVNILTLVGSAIPWESEDLQSDGKHLLSLWRNDRTRSGWKWAHLYYPIGFALSGGKYEDALQAAERALAHYPDDNAIRHDYVQAAVWAGRTESALDAVDGYVEPDSEFTPMMAAFGPVHPRHLRRFMRSSVLNDIGRFTEAKAELERILPTAENEEERAHIEAAVALTRLLAGQPGDPSDAFARLPWVPDIYYAQTVAELERDRPDRAWRILRQAHHRARYDGTEGTRAAFEAAVLAARGQRKRAERRLAFARANLAEPYAIRYAERRLAG